MLPAEDINHRRTLVEACWPGKGTAGLCGALVPGAPLLVVASSGTKYRIHRCPGALQSHSGRPTLAESKAANRAGPNAYYRSFDAKPRGRR